MLNQPTTPAILLTLLAASLLCATPSAPQTPTVRVYIETYDANRLDDIATLVELIGGEVPYRETKGGTGGAGGSLLANVPVSEIIALYSLPTVIEIDEDSECYAWKDECRDEDKLAPVYARPDTTVSAPEFEARLQQLADFVQQVGGSGVGPPFLVPVSRLTEVEALDIVETFYVAWFGFGGPGLPRSYSPAFLGKGHRFQARVQVSGFSSGGSAYNEPLGEEGAAFYFFLPWENPEVVVKVLDGCAINQHWWVYAAGLTDLELQLEILDRETGATRDYFNEADTPFELIRDIEAFPCD